MSPAPAVSAFGAPPLALWVVPVADLGGVARHTLDALTTGLPGWRAILLCPPGPLADTARARGLGVLTAPISPADGIPTGVAELRRVVSRLRPQVVHSHLSYADLLASAASIGRPVGLITTEHGIAADDLVYHGSRWRSRVKALGHSARLRRADALIAVSHSTLEVVKSKWRPSRTLLTRVIHNGVDRPAATRTRAPGLHVVSLARLAPEKGLPDLLRSFAILVSDHPEARLTIAGEGPLHGALQTLARELALDDRVLFPGHVDAQALLHRADVLAQLSVWENCSYSLLDAVAAGVGVVATPVGGNVEILPSQCLVAGDQHVDVARLLTAQGASPGQRPVLPDGWPTMVDMCADIVAVYREVTR